MDMVKIPTTDPTDYGNAPGKGPLRVGGRPAPDGLNPAHDADNPKTLSASAKRQQHALQIVRDLFAGPEKVRERGAVYLPQAPGEDGINYTVRLNRSVFFNAFRHTIEGLVGFVFRKDPVLGEDVPEPITKHWENIDNAGTHGDVFLRELMADAQTAGHAAILVEFPKTEGTQTAADEQTEIRPYWVPIRKDNILSWRSAVVNGRLVLTQVVLKECAYVPAGMFGEVLQEQYRVLFNDQGTVGYQLLEVTKENKVIEVDFGLYPTQTEIPIAEIVTSGKKSLFESEPPLIDLAYLNIAHYQGDSDYRWSIHKTNVPILFAAGFNVQDEATGTQVAIGPNSLVNAQDPTAKLEYVAHNGEALGSSQQALQDLKSDMATMGLAMLAPDKRAAETAEAKRIDKSTSDSALAVTARGLQDGAERALGFHAKYMKMDDGGSITINRDFENLTLTPQQVTALSALVRDGHLTIETLWKMLQDGNVLPDDFDEIAERGQLDAEAEIKRVQMQEDMAAAAALNNSDSGGTQKAAA
jgi:hypothetical protein